MPTLIQFVSSRTNQFGILVIVLTAMQGLVFKLPLTVVEQSAVGAAIGVAILFFRWITTQPLDAK